MKIGVVGIGKMGGAIATRLLGLGHEVVVWNRSAEKAKAVSGAKVAATPRELASDVETIISILTNAAAIDVAYEGADGLLKGDIKGKLFIEMSTVRPQTEKQLAAKARALGAAFIDCPVGGTVGPAREGKLLGFVGGDADDVARARPLLEQMCRRVEHVGPVGSGASMKLAINLPLLVYWQALGEALLLCKPLGLDPARLMNIFADTSGGPNVLKVTRTIDCRCIEWRRFGASDFRCRFDTQRPANDDRRSAGTRRHAARHRACTRMLRPGIARWIG